MTQQKYTGKIMIAFTLLLILMFFHLNGAEFNWNFNFQSSDSFILFKEIRLPRTLTAILAGSSISIAGLLMQTLFKNPLAGPSILGITSGSSLLHYIRWQEFNFFLRIGTLFHQEFLVHYFFRLSSYFSVNMSDNKLHY